MLVHDERGDPTFMYTSSWLLPTGTGYRQRISLIPMPSLSRLDSCILCSVHCQLGPRAPSWPLGVGFQGDPRDRCGVLGT